MRSIKVVINSSETLSIYLSMSYMAHLNIPEAFIDDIEKLSRLRSIIAKHNTNQRLAMKLDKFMASLICNQIKPSVKSP